MTTYRTKDFESGLEHVGFRRDETHHHMFWYYVGDKKSLLRTRTSHNEKEFGDGLFSMRRRQIGHLSKPQMLDLIEGRLTAEDYRQHVVGNGSVTLD